jgi:hypothetical protein
LNWLVRAIAEAHEREAPDRLIAAIPYMASPAFARGDAGGPRRSPALRRGAHRQPAPARAPRRRARGSG